MDDVNLSCSASSLPCEDCSAGPIACDLTVFSPAQRAEHIARTHAVFGGIRRAIEHAEGYTLVFAADPTLRARIAQWAALEGRCCPFLTFDLRFERTFDADSDEATLRISGPEEAKPILRAVLDEHGVRIEF